MNGNDDLNKSKRKSRRGKEKGTLNNNEGL